MLIKRLKIHNLRNLEKVDIEPHPALNILFGDNGVGKTSVLESIVVLSRGRSFRTNQATELIGPSDASFRVYAETSSKAERSSRIGLERSGKHWRARKDGKDLSQLSQLTRGLPLMLMEPNSHQLVSGSPETRRKFIDWGMFHVEHEFLRVWRSFSRVLKQRNAALRSRKPELLESMDEVFSELGEKLGLLRKMHSEEIAERVQVLLQELSSELEPVTLEFKRGWSQDSLKQALFDNRDNDLVKGTSGRGPHRADISLIYRGAPARAVLSRGEQKILASALLLSQAEILLEHNRVPVLLLDDLASEFDDDHYEKVLGRALQTGGQVWVTGTREIKPRQEHKMFHVEHGVVREVV